MQITENAQQKLHALATRFRHGERGFHFGMLGNCHGAVPRFRPGRGPDHGEREYLVDGVTLFMTPREYRELQPHTLDYTRGLLLSRFSLDADCGGCAAQRAC